MTEKDTKNCSGLPAARIRTIMKSSPEIEIINQESLFLITKATELFVSKLASESFKHSTNNKDISYKNLAEVVAEHDSFQFLADILPHKMKVKDFFESLEYDKQLREQGGDEDI